MQNSDSNDEDICTLSRQIIKINGMNPGPMTQNGTNTYLIGQNKNRILIDCGEGVDKYKNLLSKVLKETNSIIDTVLITHHHFDHTNGISQIIELNKNAKIKKFGCLFQDKELEKKFNFKYQPLIDGEIVKGDGFNLKVIRMSGHSEDHVCFLHMEENTLFTGDFILGGSSSIAGSDMIFQMKSYELALNLNADNLFTGHGYVIQGKEESKNEIIKNKLNRIQREQSIIECFKDDSSMLTESDLLNNVYKDLNSFQLNIAQINISSHLKKLIQEQIVFQNEQGQYQLKQQSKGSNKLNAKL